LQHFAQYRLQLECVVLARGQRVTRGDQRAV
jgi:hypothetical protein